MSGVTEQEVHQGALQRQFFGRAKLLAGAVDIVEQLRTKGGMMVVEAGPGEGKTVFMVDFSKEFYLILFYLSVNSLHRNPFFLSLSTQAALADTLRTGEKSKKKLVCDVFSYSTAASQSARSVENLLQCLVQWFRKMQDAENESPLPHSYKWVYFKFPLSQHLQFNHIVCTLDSYFLSSQRFAVRISCQIG